jgi:KDO2-lipid IV(A) lauroyltransferase
MPLGTLIQFMLPRWVMVRVARLVGALAYRLNRKGRDRFTENCRHVLGRGTPEPEIRAAVRRLFFHYVLNIFDLLRIPVLRRRITALVEFDRRQADRIMAEGRGLIVVTAHVGNWDLAGVVLAANGFPLSAVVEPVPRGWERTYNRYRQATRMETIPIPDRRAIARALLQGRVLALVSDRDLTGNGMLCPAFDAYRYYPRGPAAYVLRQKTGLIIGGCVFQHKRGRPPYAMDYRSVDFAPSGSIDADVAALTLVIADAVNGMIRKYPNQWLVYNAAWQEMP